MSESSTSDNELVEQLSDWDSEDDHNDLPSRTYETRVNYMTKFEDYEFMYRFRLSKRLT